VKLDSTRAHSIINDMHACELSIPGLNTIQHIKKSPPGAAPYLITSSIM
jgi:hypothetical protein